MTMDACVHYLWTINYWFSIQKQPSISRSFIYMNKFRNKTNTISNSQKKTSLFSVSYYFADLKLVFKSKVIISLIPK